MKSVRFSSSGTTCDAWFFEPEPGGPFERPGGCPVVVMAHGFGGTKDSGLEPFARAFRAAGLAAFVFDYRGFGASEGQPRQRISMVGQADDYRAAIGAAVRQPGVDAERVVLWGVSMAGGHVLTVAPGRPEVCAVVAMVPLVSGPAAGRHALRQVGALAIAGSTVSGMRSAVSSRLGGAAAMMPLVGRPGERAALTADGFYDAYVGLAGPTWRNEVDAAVGLDVGGFRVGREVERIAAPILIQIADFDRAAPPQAAARVAFRARAEVRHYPADHFDLFPGRPCHDTGLAHQLHFLRRHLGAEAV
ncbi:alpha/beta hydrolase [Nocardia sp. NPDC004068]|uniref:alpha/beta hydrolase n=1 Tax=Nocardia sp. NPDC004068 TaxID=3364303 RepID=UPI0036A09A5C